MANKFKEVRQEKIGKKRKVALLALLKKANLITLKRLENSRLSMDIEISNKKILVLRCQFYWIKFM